MTHVPEGGNRPNFDRREFLLRGSAVTAAGIAGLSGVAAGQGPGQGRGRNSCDVLVDGTGNGDATTVQGGVDAASPGDTVCVADGTYTEHVHVDKDLTLTNADGATPTLEIPADPPTYTVPESGNTWEVVVLVGPETGTSTVDVDVSGLELDGKNRQPGDGADVAAGLLLRNVSGAIEDVTVVGMAVGGRQTGGIAVYSESDVDIHDNTVDGYERFGIVANGDGGAHPSPTVDIRGNDVTGSGDGSQTAWGPNGIQIGYGAEGDVRDNTVDRNRWSDTRQVGSGIIVFESDGVTVSENTVTDSDAALSCGTWSWFQQTADTNRFIRNDVDGAIVGVHLESIAWDGFSTADPTLTNTTVVNNDLTQGGTGSDPADDSVGVELATVDADPDYDPILDNTKVINNDVEDFVTEIEDAGTDTKSRANAFEP